MYKKILPARLHVRLFKPRKFVMVYLKVISESMVMKFRM